MPRSEESKARRRAYTNQWHREHPGYKRNWNREHALEELERKRVWREHNRDKVREQRLRYYAKHPRRSARDDEEPFPDKFRGHEYFETCRFICGNEPYWDSSQFGWEEAMGECVLALVEGRDPNEAAAASWAYQRKWMYHTGPLYPNVDIREDTRDVVIVKRHDDWR